MGFARLPFPSPGDLSDPEREPRSLALQADSLPLSHREALWSLYGPPNVDLKQMGCQILFQQRWGYSDQQKLQVGVWNHGEPHASLCTQGKDLLEGKRKMGGLTVSKEPKAFHWLSPCWKRRGAFLPVGFAIIAEMRAPPTGLQVVLIFTWGFCINFLQVLGPGIGVVSIWKEQRLAFPWLFT